MRIDGLYISIGPISINWDLWETYCAYDARDKDGLVFVEEQRRKFLPKKRRKLTYPVNSKRFDE